MDDFHENKMTGIHDLPGIAANDPMHEAGRKFLASHFSRMLKEEPAVRERGSVDAVHDMRVATRRMRSAFRLFDDYLDPDMTNPLMRTLRKLARALGAVRDQDVFRLKADAYSTELPAAERKAFQPLLNNWLHQEEAAREPIRRLLDSGKYAKFVENFTHFVLTPGRGARDLDEVVDGMLPIPQLVRDVAPTLIYTQYGQVTAYGPYIENADLDTLHALRIEVKRFRYTVEAFVEVLGAESQTVINAVRTLQDHLGELQDTRIALNMLDVFLQSQDGDRTARAIQATARAVRHYASFCQETQGRLRETVSAAWGVFSEPEVKRAVALAVAAI